MDIRGLHAAYQSIYADDIVEHHEKDADGNVIEHDELTEEELEEGIDYAVEYFLEEEIEEADLDQIIEEVGIIDFTEFVLEERKARKMNVRSLKTAKKKAEEIKASTKDVVARGTPKDTVARARTERSLKKPKLAKPATKKVVKSVEKVKAAKPAPKKAAPKPVAKKAAPKPVAKKAAPAPKKAAPKPAPKKAAPKASKEGIRSKISTAVKKGTARHKAAVKKVTSSKAVKGAKEFGKGFVSGVKDTVKFAKKAKKAVVGETLQALLDTLEEGAKLDKFDAVIAYLVDQNLVENFEEAQKGMTVIDSDIITEIYEYQTEAMLLTNADKKANTPAWKNRDKKNPKTGEPIYKKADHLKSEGYQRNPEKGEEEERKRNKKVPGERTPMPPRGDKRREDFERWYAANVR